MSPVRNADEFLLYYRRTRGDYENLFREQIEKVRSIYSNNPTRKVPPDLDRALEAHNRTYLINALLYSLNWRLDKSPEQDLPNLVPEVPIISIDRGTTRFLDYLGMERNEGRPLLIVEAKRLSAPLPRLKNPSKQDYVASVICQGLNGIKLTGDWNKWLETLRDYVRSVKKRSGQLPLRVVITNGEWLILFLDPENAFISDGNFDPAKILVWEDQNEIETRSAELFCHLEYTSLLNKKLPVLTLGKLRFNITKEEVKCLMHGLRLLYIKRPGMYGRVVPVIETAPVIFIQTKYGFWFLVEKNTVNTNVNVFEIPTSYDKMTNHLTDLKKAAESFLQEVNRYLEADFKPAPVTDHYFNPESFALLPGVKEIDHKNDATEFLVVTGSYTHYLLPVKPKVRNCPYHDWVKSHGEGVGYGQVPITRGDCNLRSFFKSGDSHHCTHCEVANAKEQRITNTNRDRCGLRSGEEGQAFFEIFRFEKFLCCRACAFEVVCTKAEVFCLPCE